MNHLKASFYQREEEFKGFDEGILRFSFWFLLWRSDCSQEI